MKTTATRWTEPTGWNWPETTVAAPQLVLYFGATARLQGDGAVLRELGARFPGAVVCGCSTAGEILGSHVQDDSIVAAALQFDGTRVRAVVEPGTSQTDSHAIGQRAATALLAPDLRHVLILSDGLSVNGTALVAGLRDVLGPAVAITGGLAGDGARFRSTLVGLGETAAPNQVVAVGFYGAEVMIGYGSRGGWVGFGPRRLITKSRGNTLLELDGQPALALYKRYLGERAAGLPATGLLFPLELTRDLAEQRGLVRTILATTEDEQSLTFAGDLPEGWYARLMMASSDQLVQGAADAGEDAVGRIGPAGDSLAILVSCVGRRLVLGQRTDEELEAVCGSFRTKTETVGFYSYGETCPTPGTVRSELHNQTMTVTVISEAD